MTLSPDMRRSGIFTDEPAPMRKFDTGATRDTEEGKPDYEGFLSPLVLERFAAYMHKHRIQPDGTLRASDNWQKGIPQEAYIKSGWRHFVEWWSLHRQGRPAPLTHEEQERRIALKLYADDPAAAHDAHLEEALCALIFNAQGYLHEHLKAKR